MDWLWTILGIVLLFATLADLYQTLLHPTGRGRLTWLIVKAVWGISKSLKHRPQTFTGPVIVISVVALWVLLSAIGWALIYYPHYPEGFSYAADINHEQYPDFLEAMYLSLLTFSTLGYGDVVPTDEWIRLAAPLQAVTGFAVFTAAIAWFMQAYPALEDRRGAAIRLMLMHKAGYIHRIRTMDPGAGSQLMERLAEEITKVEASLTRSAEIYYFRESNNDISFPVVVSCAVGLCKEARKSEHADIRDGGELAQAALDDLAGLLKNNFPPTGDTTDEVFRSYAHDHGRSYTQEPPGSRKVPLGVPTL